MRYTKSASWEEGQKPLSLYLFISRLYSLSPSISLSLYLYLSLYLSISRYPSSLSIYRSISLHPCFWMERGAAAEPESTPI